MNAATDLKMVEKDEPEEYQGSKWRRFVSEEVKKPAEKATKHPNWPDLASTAAEIAGIGSISAGAWLMSPSAGLICAGIGAIALGIAAGR